MYIFLTGPPSPDVIKTERGKGKKAGTTETTATAEKKELIEDEKISREVPKEEGRVFISGNFVSVDWKLVSVHL